MEERHLNPKAHFDPYAYFEGTKRSQIDAYADEGKADLRDKYAKCKTLTDAQLEAAKKAARQIRKNGYKTPVRPLPPPAPHDDADVETMAVMQDTWDEEERLRTEMAEAANAAAPIETETPTDAAENADETETTATETPAPLPTEQPQPVRAYRPKMSVEEARARLAAQMAAANEKAKAKTDAALEKLTGAKQYDASLDCFGGMDGADFFAAKLPPPKWIVKDFIAQGMKGDLCGSSKTFKTYLGLQLGLCIATGRDFLGLFKVDAPHVVAYVNLELFDWNFQERMKAQMSPPCTNAETGKPCGGLGISVTELRGRFFAFNLRGNANAVRDGVERLVKLLKELGVEIVIVDPRYKLLKNDEDENTGTGLQGVLDLRDRLAQDFAVILVTHDPKGDTAQKKTTDRGAGSYRAGADYDFRLTIDKADGWTHDNLVYVVEADGRARKTPQPIGATFDTTAQTFHADADVSPVKMTAGARHTMNSLTPEQSANKNAALQKSYRDAALKVCAAARTLLSTATFDLAMKKEPGAQMGTHAATRMRKALIADGTLATCNELCRDGKTGGVINKYHGETFISTPEKIAAYKQRFENLA